MMTIIMCTSSDIILNRLCKCCGSVLWRGRPALVGLLACYLQTVSEPNKPGNTQPRTTCVAAARTTSTVDTSFALGGTFTGTYLLPPEGTLLHTTFLPIGLRTNRPGNNQPRTTRAAATPNYVYSGGSELLPERLSIAYKLNYKLEGEGEGDLEERERESNDCR